MRTWLWAIILSFAFVACTKSTEPKSGPSGEALKIMSDEEMLKSGQRVYSTQCISCHGPDPKKDGPLGPAVFGSSLELIKLRVLSTEYPSGYTPKRTTKMMQPMPHLKNEIENLHKFLNQN